MRGRNKLIFLLLFGCWGLVARGEEQIPLQRTREGSQTHPDSALILLKRVHAAAVEKGDDLVIGNSLQQMGKLCFNQGHYAQALDFYLHAETIFERLKNKERMAANMSETGILYYYNKQLGRSRTLYNKALALYRQTGNQSGQAEIFGNIGHLYEKQHRYDSAFYYQHLALDTYHKIGDRAGAAKIYENLGSIYEDLERYSLALPAFRESLRLYTAANNEVASIEVINNMGDILRKTGQYAEALRFSRQALQLAGKGKNSYQLAAACRDLGKTFQLMGRMDSAYLYVERSRRYSLDIYSREGVTQTTFLQVLYDINKQNAEISRLNAIRKINRITTISIGAVIVLLLIIFLVILSRQRLKIRDQHALALQQESIFAARQELMELELKNKRLEEDSLKQLLELKSKELSGHTLSLIRNNQLLEQLRNALLDLVKEDKRDQKKQMQQIVQQINEQFNHEQHWKEFTSAFEQVHQQFFDKLKAYSQDLTSADIRLITLLKINLDSKDIATLLGLSTDSLRVSRYRLRKKLRIAPGDNLSSFIQAL